MSSKPPSSSKKSKLTPEAKFRRRFLSASTAIAGAVGVVSLAVPLVRSMSPSARERAAGAPIEVDISKLDAGQMVTYLWRGKPIWVIRRSQFSLDHLQDNNNLLSDPDSAVNQQPEYAHNAFRSRKPDVLVLVAVCTHLGCIPTYRPEIAPRDLGQDWAGGFYCPCHGSKFDLAGRVYSGVPAPINLAVPRYSYVSDHLLVIGKDEEGTA